MKYRGYVAALALATAGCIDLPAGLAPAVDAALDGAGGAGGEGAAGGEGGQGGQGGEGGQGGGGGAGGGRCDAAPWALLDTWGAVEAVGQPTVTDVDGDGYRDLILASQAEAGGVIRVAYGGPTGLACGDTVQTAARPWRVGFARVGDGVETLVALEQDANSTWALRGYPLASPTDVWSVQIPPLGLAEESFSSDRPLFVQPVPQGGPGDALAIGSFYYLLSTVGPGAGPAREIMPSGDAPTYAALMVAPLDDGSLLMLEDGRWRTFEWSTALSRLTPTRVTQLPRATNYRVAALSRVDGVMVALGHALDGRLFDVFTLRDGRGSLDAYAHPRPVEGLVTGLMIGELRARGDTDVVALIDRDGTDEGQLSACVAAGAGACAEWVDTPIRAPTPRWAVSGDFDSPIGTPSPHELLFFRDGEAGIDCWRLTRDGLRDVLGRCE